MTHVYLNDLTIIYFFSTLIKDFNNIYFQLILAFNNKKKH